MPDILYFGTSEDANIHSLHLQMHHGPRSWSMSCRGAVPSAQRSITIKQRLNVGIEQNNATRFSSQSNHALRNTSACLQSSHRRPCRLTISSVQTLLIQTLRVPSTPSTFSKSTPSHQHRLAGFRQNNRSFCAMPTALELAISPRTSLRNRASAMLQMTALFGSPAR